MPATHPEASHKVFALMRRLRAMGDADYLQYLVAYHAAPTVQGLKPATLVCPGAAGRDLAAALGECGPRLEAHFGVKVAGFRNRAGNMLLLVYNRRLLHDALSARGVTDLLGEAGYDVPAESVETLLARLRHKCAGVCFPHEIGVFLGYPPRDVRRFMDEGGRGCRNAGCWKAFADADAAGRRASRFRRAKLRAADLIVDGADLGEMAAGLRLAI